MKTQVRIWVAVLLLIPCVAQSQVVCTSQSRYRLDTTLAKMAKTDFKILSINEAVVKIGKWFLNTPYVEKTLDVAGDEPLVINLTGLDCTTYLENVVTLARLGKKGKFSYEDYKKELEFVRYRNGRRGHYPSRLHYFSDWIFENQRKGIIEDITQSIGGVAYENQVGFMSANPQLYAQLSNEEFVKQIQKTEADIARRTYYYIPKARVEQLESGIQPGDLIAITIAMDNLDIAHVGIAVRQGGRIHLMHASLAGKRVIISEKPLSDYLLGIKKHSGIMVGRLKEPTR